VPAGVKGEFTTVPKCDAGPIQVTLKKTAFTVK